MHLAAFNNGSGQGAPASLTCQIARRQKLGAILMARAIAECQALFGHAPIRIGAQSRLIAYYRQHGFVEVGATYLEDNIDHQDMVWSP